MSTDDKNASYFSHSAITRTWCFISFIYVFLICYCNFHWSFLCAVFNIIHHNIDCCTYLRILYYDLKLQLVRKILIRLDLRLRDSKTLKFYNSIQKKVTYMVFKRIGVILIQIISAERDKETCQDTDNLVQQTT